MRVHLSKNGEWVACHAVQRACPRLFHLPNMTPTEVKALPEAFMERLIEAVDPPTQITMSAGREWLDENGQWHRENDLPARIDPDGTRYWYTHNLPSKRPGDKPNMTYPDGSMEWYNEDDELHRDGDKPALIYPEYQAWYQHGKMIRAEAFTPEFEKILAQDALIDDL